LTDKAMKAIIILYDQFLAAGKGTATLDSNHTITTLILLM